LRNQGHLTAQEKPHISYQEETMASNFTHFLISFGEDPQQLEAFKQDPHAVLDAAGLTPAEKTLLLSGNKQLIRSALIADPGLKAALGIHPDQNLPSNLPSFIYFIYSPVTPPPQTKGLT
jgi:hypothetical protein